MSYSGERVIHLLQCSEGGIHTSVAKDIKRTTIM